MEESGEKVVRWPKLGGEGQRPLPSGPLRRIIPGMVTGASDVDPALVLTATVAGAAYQYSLLWSVLLCVPFLLSVFAVSARIGNETRKGLVDLLRGNYGRRVAVLCAGLIVVINMAMIVADLMAVTDAFSMLMQLPRMFFIAAVAFLVWYILIFQDYRKITHAMVLLSLPLFIFVPAAILAHPNWKLLITDSVFPHIPRGAGYAETIVA